MLTWNDSPIAVTDSPLAVASLILTQRAALAAELPEPPVFEELAITISRALLESLDDNARLLVDRIARYGREHKVLITLVD